MNKLLLASAVGLALVSGGLWLSMRRQPTGTMLSDAPGAFRVEPAGAGRFLQLQDPQIPLRALRWLGPYRDGLLAAQVLTQSDRQEVVFFRDGQPMGQVMVLKPFGISEGFWRFAVLKEVAELPGGEAALLYAPADAASSEPAVVIAMDMAHGDVRWTHRGAFSRMVLTDGAEPALVCYGAANPIQRLALAAARAGEAGRTGPNAAAKSLELPPEVPAVEDLLPTGGASFLVSHAKGLSAYRGSKGWTHLAAPADRGVPSTNWRASLVRAGKTIWWQPWPGQMLSVHADGTEPSAWEVEEPEAGDPTGPDRQLLQLAGADAEGALWFTLAKPAPPVAAVPTPVQGAALAPTAPALPAQGAALAPTAPALPAQAAPPETSVPAPAPAMDWLAYQAKGLDRIYRWHPHHPRMEQLVWSQVWQGLKAPGDVGQPGPGQELHPESGALRVEGARGSWWLPLKALPFR